MKKQNKRKKKKVCSNIIQKKLRIQKIAKNQKNTKIEKKIKKTKKMKIRKKYNILFPKKTKN